MTTLQSNDEQIRQLFVRVCRDSGFTIDSTQAAVIAARAMNISPLYVWLAVGSIDAMDRIASGAAALPQTAALSPEGH